MKALEIALTIIRLFPAILQAVDAAEKAIPGEGKGKEKLRLVLDVLEHAWNTAVAIAGPVGQVAWAQLAGPIGALIEKIVGALNGAGVFAHGAK